METNLLEFLGRHRVGFEHDVLWADGKMPIRVRGSACREIPPREYVTSVRAVTFRDGKVLVVRNRHTTHDQPGGRIEAGETVEDALRRELLEETGWEVQPTNLIGVTHLQHLGPKPAGYSSPYPDFLWLIYRAEAVRRRDERRVADDYEMESRFMEVDEARALLPDAAGRFYLDAAIAWQVEQ